MKNLSNFELPLWLNCNQIDSFMKYGWNTIVLGKVSYLRHFVQNLLGVKVHTSCKISKFCQQFGAKTTHVDRIYGI